MFHSKIYQSDGFHSFDSPIKAKAKPLSQHITHHNIHS